MESLKTYIITYIVYGKQGEILKQGKMKAKRKRSSFEAKTKFGEHIEKKYGDLFGRLIISDCKEDYDLDNLFNSEHWNKPEAEKLRDLFSGYYKGKKI